MCKLGLTSLMQAYLISWFLYDHTNECVTNDVHDKDDGMYRCYGCWFGHDWKVSIETATELLDLSKTTVCIRIISENIVIYYKFISIMHNW